MINLTFNSIGNFSSILMWTRGISQTAGFTLIALSYFVAGRYQGITKRSYLIILLGTALLIAGIFVFFFALSGSLELESVYSSPFHIFSVVNLILISYITLFLWRKAKSTSASLKNSLSGALAFSSLWIGQFIFLVWSMTDLGTVLLIGSQVGRLIGFAFLIQIYYSAKKEVSTIACDQAK